MHRAANQEERPPDGGHAFVLSARHAVHVHRADPSVACRRHPMPASIRDTLCGHGQITTVPVVVDLVGTVQAQRIAAPRRLVAPADPACAPRRLGRNADPGADGVGRIPGFERGWECVRREPAATVEEGAPALHALFVK